jgi:thiosulfate/3-mercaptopyruvate sulfurtransferase
MPEEEYKLLVDADALGRHIGDPAWVVIDCRFSLAEPDWGGAQYREGHIPGAHFAHLDQDLSSPIQPDTGRHPLPDAIQLAGKLSRWGLDADAQAVVYDDAGGAFAARLWWLLRWLGHERVALLNGGLPAWLAGGRPVEQAEPEPRQRRFVPRRDDNAWLTTADIRDNLDTGCYQLVDARAPARFRGEMEPIDPVSGHIPGAVNLPLTGNLDEDGRFLPPALLRERFLASLGEQPPELVVHSCGSGVNACHNILAMELAGLPGSKLYAGSWSEWIRSPERPVATGP